MPCCARILSWLISYNPNRCLIHLSFYTAHHSSISFSKRNLPSFIKSCSLNLSSSSFSLKSPILRQSLFHLIDVYFVQTCKLIDISHMPIMQAHKRPYCKWSQSKQNYQQSSTCNSISTWYQKHSLLVSFLCYNMMATQYSCPGLVWTTLGVDTQTPHPSDAHKTWTSAQGKYRGSFPIRLRLEEPCEDISYSLFEHIGLLGKK